MMHLPIHLVEEMFICGPVHTRWMYPFERYMKGLKGFVKNKSKPEGSMAYGYLREEAIGFLNEYLSQYTPTSKRAWDDKEEPAMYDEILEGVRRDRPMISEFQRMVHGFVLDNTAHMEPYRRRYEEALSMREVERNEYRRAQRRDGRRNRFAYPRELQELPAFAEWVLEEVRREEQGGLIVPNDVVDTARGSLPNASAYKSMYAFGNHYRVLSCEGALRTSDSGVAATFKQVCRNGIRDGNQVNADVEYVGHIEEILELNYRRHCLVVFVCDFVKANSVGENATIKKDRWGFTLANYDRRFGSITRDSFAFPAHCEQVFYAKATESPGWRVVLRKEVRGRRVLPTDNEDTEGELFQMGHDEDFDGLRPDREVGEGQIRPAATGQDVPIEAIRRPRRNRGRGAAIGVGRGGRRGRGGRGRSLGRGRGRGRGRDRSPMPEVSSEQGSEAEDDIDENEQDPADNLMAADDGRRRRGRVDEEHEQRRVRSRAAVQGVSSEEGNTSENSDMNASTSSSSWSLSSGEDSEGNDAEEE